MTSETQYLPWHSGRSRPRAALEQFTRTFTRFEEAHRTLRNELSTVPIDSAFRRFSPIFQGGLEKLAACEKRLDAPERGSALRLVRHSELIDWVLEAPIYRQIIEKPRGYVGDAELMRLFYRSGYLGETPFGRLYHRLATELPEGQAVRNRREFIAVALRRLDQGDSVLSVACGPCAELFDVDPERRGFEFVGVDHDPQTLAEIVGENGLPPGVRLGLGNALQFIKDRPMVAFPKRLEHPDASTTNHERVALEPNTFSLVYSAGLFDYIPTDLTDDRKGAVGLTSRLFELVRPGGELIIGNFGPAITRGTRFCMEYICDWNLIYRNATELRRLARNLPLEQVAGVVVDAEPQGINLFLRVNKRL